MMGMEGRLVQAALEAGAARAAVIPADMVVLSAEFADICATNACGQYGRNWMCPPEVGDIHQLMDRVRAYPQALVYQTISPLEDSYDWEGMQAASAAHAQLSRRLRRKLSGLIGEGSLHLTCGGCGLCASCTKAEGQPCRFPEEALPSVESYGIDVYNTVKGTDLKYINGPDTVTYFGMVFFDEGACPG